MLATASATKGNHRKMKVSELIDVLKTYPPDAPVVALWDGGWAHIEEHSLEKGTDGVDVVELNVTEYGTYEDQ